MRKIKLNEIIDNKNVIGEYNLLPTKKYVINIEEEWDFQMAVMTSFKTVGVPPALKNYHVWLFENGFNVNEPNPSNEFVARYYGVIWVLINICN